MVSRAAYSRAWRAANPEKVAAQNARAADRKKAWRAAHPERVAAYNRQYRATHPADPRPTRPEPSACYYCHLGPCKGICGDD